MKAKVIAFYLPQYHPIPENDKWWGPGFTEWNNVVKAKPLFRGHYQPRLPADLGFYDLRLPEVRQQQANLAREAGIEGFCYYHYWFGNGKQLLQRPFDEVLASGEPDLPFCLCWANHDWTNKTWQKGMSIKSDSNIMTMHYDFEDHKKHFFHLLPAFMDKRYITVDGKPLFVIWAPKDFPQITEFIAFWKKLAEENGLSGIHFVGYTSNASGRSVSGKKLSLWADNEAAEHYNEILNMGFDAVISMGLYRGQALGNGKFKMLAYFLSNKLPIQILYKADYEKVMKHYYVDEDGWENVYPTLMPQWDRTPRAGTNTYPLINSTPEKFQKSIETVLKIIEKKHPEHKLLFLKSWNEWGEGNYVEPDQKYGHGYLRAIRNAIDD